MSASSQTDTSFSIGHIVTVALPGDMKRLGKVIAVDPHGETVLVRYLNFQLPPEWIPVAWL